MCHVVIEQRGRAVLEPLLPAQPVRGGQWRDLLGQTHRLTFA
jgi:hypothetical protein